MLSSERCKTMEEGDKENAKKTVDSDDMFTDLCSTDKEISSVLASEPDDRGGKLEYKAFLQSLSPQKKHAKQTDQNVIQFDMTDNFSNDIEISAIVKDLDEDSSVSNSMPTLEKHRETGSDVDDQSERAGNNVEDSHCVQLNGFHSTSGYSQDKVLLNRLQTVMNGAKIWSETDNPKNTTAEEKSNDVLKATHSDSSNDCKDNDSNNKNSERNIFDILSKSSSDNVKDGNSTEGGDKIDPEIAAELVLNPWSGKKSKQVKRNTGTDFESATGDSQFNFYDANDVVDNTIGLENVNGHL